MGRFVEVLALVLIALNIFLLMQNGHLRDRLAETTLSQAPTPTPTPGPHISAVAPTTPATCALECPDRHRPDAGCTSCECAGGWEGGACDVPQECAPKLGGRQGPACMHGGYVDPTQCVCKCKAGWGGLFCDKSVAAPLSAIRAELESMRDAMEDGYGDTQQTGCITCTISRTTLSPDPLMKPTPIIQLSFNASERAYNHQEVPLEVAVYPNLGGLSWPTRYAKEYQTLRQMTVETTLPELGGMVDLAPAVAYNLESTFAAKYPDSKLTLQVAAYQLYRMALPRNGNNGAFFSFPLSPAAAQFYQYLPTTFDPKDSTNLDKWLLAFQTWGTSTLVETVYGGMHARIITSTPYYDDAEELHVELCLGGNAGSDLQCGNIDSWRSSLLDNPAIIRYRAVPLSEFAPVSVREALQDALTYYENDQAQKQASQLISCPPSCHNGGSCASPSFKCECKSDGISTFQGTTCNTPEYHVFNSSSADTKLTPAATTSCVLQYGVSLVEGYEGGALVYISMCGLIVHSDGFWHMSSVAFNGKPYYCLANCKALPHVWSS